MTWRMAKSLDILLKQINDKYPNRSKASDGGIGDAAHASRSSDHNPWIKDRNGVGVVSARDFTHDPKHGLNSEKLAELLRMNRDPRIKYIISNRKICASYKVGRVEGWIWRPYYGKNPHDHHVHVSVKSESFYYDNYALWKI